MLAVPLKVSTPVDFKGALTKYIQENYSNVSESSYVESLDSLNAMRKECAVLDTDTSDTSKQEADRNKLYQYYAQLCSMQGKFPISPSNKSVKLSFSWKDAFRPSKKVTQHSIVYERAAVLFNIGALLTTHGLRVDPASPDYNKLAAKYFSQGAGVYQHLKDAVLPQLTGATTTDLSAEGLTMIIKLMLAQAQAQYYSKCFETPAAQLTRGNEKKKNALCAKLAKKASEWYGEAKQVLAAPTLSAVIVKAWGLYFRYQEHCFTAIAQYKQSEVDHETADDEGEGYGIELGRLAISENEARAAVNIAQQNRQDVGSKELEDAKRLLGKIQARRRERLNENDQIYRESVAAAGDLPAITGIGMAKTIYPAELAVADPTCVATPPPRGAEGKSGPPPSYLDLFAEMVPAAANNASNRYRSKLDVMVTDMSKEADTASQTVRQQLAKIGLPASIEASSASVGIPDEVWAKVTEVRDIGGVSKLSIMVNTNKSEASAIEKMLGQIDSQLAAEEKSDREYRAQHAAAWTAVPSETLNRQIRADHSRYGKLLRDASSSDQLVEQLLRAKMATLNTLAGSRAEYDQRMPQVSAATAAAVAPVRNLLIRQLKELNVTLKKRVTLVDSLRAAANRDDITDRLLAAGCGAVSIGESKSATWSDSKEQALFEEALSRHDPIKNKIFTSMTQQMELFEQIQKTNMEFQRVKQDNQTTRQREAVLGGINQAVLDYHDVHAKLKMGNQFYSDLRMRVEQLQQTVDGHVHGRQLQAQELLLNLRRANQVEAQIVSDTAYARTLEAQPVAPHGAQPSVTASPVAAAAPPPYGDASASGLISAASAVAPPSYNSAGTGGAAPAGQVPLYGGVPTAPAPATTASQPSYGAVPVIGASVGGSSAASTYGAVPPAAPSPQPPSYSTTGSAAPAYGSVTAPPAYGQPAGTVSIGAGWGGTPAAPPAAAPPTTHLGAPPPSRYASELATLSGMGFTDQARNVALLDKHNGNVQAAVAELL